MIIEQNKNDRKYPSDAVFLPSSVPVQSSQTEYSLNPDYFYPQPRDSSNETLLDFLEGEIWYRSFIQPN